NPSILAELPEKRYMSKAPANPLTKLRDTLSVGPATTNLKGSFAYNELTKQVKLASWGKNLIQDAVEAKEPAYVQLLYAGYGEQIVPVADEEGDYAMQAVFRADWRGKDIMQLGHHSVIFGFTTDLPPVDETIRIEDDVNAREGNGIVAAAAQGVAPGTAPTPTPPAAAAAIGTGGGALGLGGRAGIGGGLGGGLGGGFGG